MKEYEVTIKSTMELERVYLVVAKSTDQAESVALRRYEEGGGEYTEETLYESIREISTQSKGEIE